MAANSIPREGVGASSFRASIANALTYSKFAQATYKDEDLADYERFGWVEMMRRQGVTEQRINELRATGFDANVYVQKQTNRAVIAYRGTDAKNPFGSDMTTNVANLQNVTTKQQGAAVLLARSAISSGYSISNTGHSLGGNLCQRVAIETNTQCVTFNSAPVGGVTDAQRRAANVFNFRFQGDLAGPALRGTGYAGHVFSIRPPSNFSLSGTMAGEAERNHDLRVFEATAREIEAGTHRGNVQFRNAAGQKRTVALAPTAVANANANSPEARVANQMARLPKQRDAVSASAPPVSAAPSTPSGSPPAAAQPTPPSQTPALGSSPATGRPLPEPPRSAAGQQRGEQPARPPIASLPPNAPNQNPADGGPRPSVPNAGAPAAPPAQSQGGVRTDSETLGPDRRIGGLANNPTLQRLRTEFAKPENNVRATDRTAAAPVVEERQRVGIPEAYRKQLAEQARIRRENEAARQALLRQGWERMSAAQRRWNPNADPNNPCRVDYNRVGALPMECYQRGGQTAPQFDWSPVVEGMIGAFISGAMQPRGGLSYGGNLPAQGYGAFESCEQKVARERAMGIWGASCLQNLQKFR